MYNSGKRALTKRENNISTLRLYIRVYTPDETQKALRYEIIHAQQGRINAKWKRSTH